MKKLLTTGIFLTISAFPLSAHAACNQDMENATDIPPASMGHVDIQHSDTETISFSTDVCDSALQAQKDTPKHHAQNKQKQQHEAGSHS